MCLLSHGRSIFWKRSTSTSSHNMKRSPPETSDVNNHFTVSLTLQSIPTMSDSEDDFMSDKFLVDVVPEEKTTYTARRSRAQLEGLRKSQAHNARMLPLKQREEEQRRAGLSKSLFDDDDDEDTAPRGGIGSSSAAARKDPPKKDAGQAKAMDFMRKMGWTPGEGLGRRRSASPERRPRKEPIRISMWAGMYSVCVICSVLTLAGRKGLTARSPSPPPLPKRLGPDDIAPTAQARLEREAGEFRGRRGADFTLRDIERKEAKAREILVELDEKKGIKVGIKVWRHTQT